MHASSKAFLFSYLMQGLPDGDGASTLGLWNLQNLKPRALMPIVRTLNFYLLRVVTNVYCLAHIWKVLFKSTS